MARRVGAGEWQLAYRDQTWFAAKRQAMVDLRCEPWEVEVEPYRRDCNWPERKQ
jgi:hypothetical protein